MALNKAHRTGDTLDLPPAFSLKIIREAGDAFAHALELREKTAGTLVWARRFQLAEFAVVLEPAEPLAEARLAFFAAMNAMADTLAVHCPPEKPVAFDWPDTLLLDGGVLGGGRLAWSQACQEDETPDWLIFSGMLRTAGHQRTEPGEWTRGVALTEEGIWDIQPREIVESFARHLMAALHNWSEFGPGYELSRWKDRWRKPAPLARLDEMANLCTSADSAHLRAETLLTQALAAPSWLDPKTKEPWL